ncbi:HEPN domain-containing protein [Hyphomonas sp.]|uniref:HEPN domain-containing protein n=1 Tax=Hyphomonas sp. TaxID=87 RepID=UPI0025BFAEC0|nr:HEPN domain-containing protein [Hyphomonas sp.]
MTKTAERELTYAVLKPKQREIRSRFPEQMGLRIHRAISWLGRSEQETDDHDLRFILLWVGFNAAYAHDVGTEVNSERGAFKAYFDALVELDVGHRIYNAVWTRFPHEIRVLLTNKYVFAPFWNHQNGQEGYKNWAESLEVSQRVISMAMAQRDTSRLLSVVFDRLYVLRNQLVHGGATWNSSVNRNQVRDGGAVLGTLLPIFIDIMMDNPSRNWGKPFYPVVS